MSSHLRTVGHTAWLLFCLAFSVSAIARSARTDHREGRYFSRTCRVWVQGNDDACGYVVGDVSVKASELEAALRTETHKGNGVELLTSANTPLKCVKKFRRAAKLAGFSLFRTRRSTKQDEDATAPPRE